MVDFISTQDLINAKQDIEDIGLSVNTDGVITPRYGPAYDSLPKVIREMIEQKNLKLSELQAAINAAEAAGAGASGWVSSLILHDNGETQKQINDYIGATWYSRGGGYGVNDKARLANGEIVVSIIANNTNNPNTDMTGWDFADKIKIIFKSVAEMSSTIANNNDVAYLRSYRDQKPYTGFGFFEFDSTKTSINDGGNIINGWVRQVHPRYLNAMNFGASADGNHNTYYDHEAIQRIKNVIKNSSEKSFVVHFDGGEYIIGKQEFTAGVGFTNEDGLNIDFDSMSDKYIIVQSDNAIFKLRNNSYYGVFDKNTKEPFTTTMPFYPNTPSWVADGDKVSVVETGFIFNFNNIKGLITKGSFTCDGNMENCIIGGQYGDTGWQLIAYGFRVARIESFEVSNIRSLNNCLDGVYIAGINNSLTPDVINPNYTGTVRSVVTSGNGRQGFSLGGGQNISFYDCSSDNIGMPEFKVQSMPKSCFDIEAELFPIRNIKFYNCFFGNAPTTSLVADSADTRNVQFFGCRFINSYGITAWVRKPEFKFFDCYFNGYMEGQYGTFIEGDRTVYQGCIFTDDPKYNPNYVAGNRYLINASGANPIFKDCTIDLYSSGLPYSVGFNGNVGQITVFDNLIINIYGTNGNSAMLGVSTIRMRDLRTTKDDWSPPMYSTSNSTIVIENLSGDQNKIHPYGFSGSIKVSTELGSPYNSYVRMASSVNNATGSDNTATVLNDLISKLKSAGFIS